MPLLRPSTMFRSAVLRPAFYTAPRARMQVRFATQDYGSGEGNPRGAKPQQQGANPSESLEHPGPPPPKVAEGQSSSSPNNDDTKEASKSSGSSSSGKSTSEKEVRGAQPKILNDSSPPKSEQDESVKKHNEEMDQRADRAHEQIDKEGSGEKVAPSFWAGEFYCA
ncbi:hypothetical protein P154DRAFT_545959 [Amniculicola lignicola CBS 123094]|uniref:Uncharacterized protein n=1 Tax=Amniculicola lignicola CBS 123094 TaxID=1392246 RepID=A0A6A5WRA3_9PLEO|nr:hypothetical protein P154DRAFT_545959 [Amniculicola lignicola CBS 123094]